MASRAGRRSALQLGRLADAEREYATRRFTFADHPIAVAGLARVEAARGDFAAALAGYREARGAAPTPESAARMARSAGGSAARPTPRGTSRSPRTAGATTRPSRRSSRGCSPRAAAPRTRWRSPSAPPPRARTCSRWTRSRGRISRPAAWTRASGVAAGAAHRHARSRDPVSCGRDSPPPPAIGPRPRMLVGARPRRPSEFDVVLAPAARALLARTEREALSATPALHLIMRAVPTSRLPRPRIRCALARGRRRWRRAAGVAGRADAARARAGADARDGDVHAGRATGRRAGRSRVAAREARDSGRPVAVDWRPGDELPARIDALGDVALRGPPSPSTASPPASTFSSAYVPGAAGGHGEPSTATRDTGRRIGTTAATRHGVAATAGRALHRRRAARRAPFPGQLRPGARVVRADARERGGTAVARRSGSRAARTARRSICAPAGRPPWWTTARQYSCSASSTSCRRGSITSCSCSASSCSARPGVRCCGR